MIIALTDAARTHKNAMVVPMWAKCAIIGLGAFQKRF